MPKSRRATTPGRSTTRCTGCKSRAALGTAGMRRAPAMMTRSDERLITLRPHRSAGRRRRSAIRRLRPECLSCLQATAFDSPKCVARVGRLSCGSLGGSALFSLYPRTTCASPGCAHIDRSRATALPTRSSLIELCGKPVAGPSARRRHSSRSRTFSGTERSAMPVVRAGGGVADGSRLEPSEKNSRWGCHLACEHTFVTSQGSAYPGFSAR